MLLHVWGCIALLPHHVLLFCCPVTPVTVSYLAACCCVGNKACMDSIHRQVPWAAALGGSVMIAKKHKLFFSFLQASCGAVCPQWLLSPLLLSPCVPGVMSHCGTEKRSRCCSTASALASRLQTSLTLQQGRPQAAALTQMLPSDLMMLYWMISHPQRI